MRRRLSDADREVVERLRRVPMFQDLGDRELAAVASAGKVIDRPAGAVLAQEGESGAGFFVLLDGSAEVRFGDRTHRELQPGDTFGEVALLDDGPRTATVVAADAVRMLGLTAWAFRAILQEHPSVAMRLLEVLAGHIRRSSQDLPGS